MATSNATATATSSLERRLGDVRPHAATNGGSDIPLTVFAQHKVLKGKEQAFEEWYKKISKATQQFEGYLGSEVIRPMDSSSKNEYVSIFRYDNYEHLQIWMQSPERMALLAATTEFEEGPVVLAFHSLEYSYNSIRGASNAEKQQQPPQPPNIHKMALLTFLTIWLQVHYLPPYIARIPNLPPLAGEALIVFIIVALTTYVIFPVLTNYLLHWWLFPTTTSTSTDQQRKQQENRTGTQEENSSLYEEQMATMEDKV